MTKKDYELLAGVFREAGLTKEEFDKIVSRLAIALKVDNRHFNPEKFIDACKPLRKPRPTN